MEEVIDYEFLRGNQDEVIVKELSLAAKNVIHTFNFQSPYGMTPHGSDENGLNWDDGHIPYRQLETVLSESVEDSHISTVMAFQNANFSKNCSVAPL